MDGHDTLFPASEVEAMKSLSADYSVAKSLDCAEWSDCHKELAVQLKFPLLIHHPKVRLTLLKLQHITIESTHLYDSICSFRGLRT